MKLLFYKPSLRKNILGKVVLGLTGAFLLLPSLPAQMYSRLPSPSKQANDPLPPGGIKLQVVAFGDSLEDVGTYAPVIEPKFGGGLFTTNPGEIWPQLVAAHYGDKLTPAFVGGFGMPLLSAGGMGFAQGGSRVSLQPGVGHAAAGTPNADFAEKTTIPVTQQVSEYLAAYGSFNSNQLVLMNGGGNDLLVNLQAAQSDPLKLPAAIIAVEKAAVELAGVITQVRKAGATHIVVLNVADFGSAPEGLATFDQGKTLRVIVKAFNDTLKTTLFLQGSLNKVIYIDSFSFLDQVIANFQGYGFTVSNTAIACNLQAQVALATQLGLNDPAQFADSLACSPQTYVTPTADQTFMFADAIHPTARYSALFAQFVEQQIAASGLGK